MLSFAYSRTTRTFLVERRPLLELLDLVLRQGKYDDELPELHVPVDPELPELQVDPELRERKRSMTESAKLSAKSSSESESLRLLKRRTITMTTMIRITTTPKK